MLARFSLVVLALSLLTGLLAPSWARAQEGRTKVGSAGCEGGAEFADEELPKGARVIGVKNRHGLYIGGIEPLIKTADGKKEGLGCHGDGGGVHRGVSKTSFSLPRAQVRPDDDYLVAILFSILIGEAPF